MASRGPLRPEIRRRRVVALLVGTAVVAVAAGVSVDAVDRHARPAPAATPAPARARPFRIVFPEGFTRAQMALRVRDVARIAAGEHRAPVALAEGAYLRASTSSRVPCFGGKRYGDSEGFLFPATYDFLARTSSRTLVGDQLETFCQRWNTVNLAYARSRDLSSYDVLIIASMIEREAAVASERRLIAAVIYNRLREGMQLGIDATLRYGLHIPPGRPITESELQSGNPYNTRRFYGLPPTPIANPGLASIQAAAHPAHVDYLYYALRPGTRRHFFTASVTAFDRFLASHGYK
jgi:UPF0755 protein